MWCAVQIGEGGEAGAEALVERLLPEGLARCIHLTRSRRKKYGGRWLTVRERLLPGYVFLDTERPEAVRRMLERAHGIRLLSSGGHAHGSGMSSGGSVSVLDAEEEGFLGRLAGEDGEIALSLVRVSGDGSVEFISGPLADVRELVRKVDLHRRVAVVEADILGRRRALHLGIEIAGRTEVGGCGT